MNAKEKELAQKIEALAEPMLGERGLELVDLDLSYQGRRLWVRLFIDLAEVEGIGVDECGEVNLELSRLLDVEDLIQGSYTLEVSSPGLDRRVRKLKDFKRFIGREATVALVEPQDGKKRIKGSIVDADESAVTVLGFGGNEYRIGHDNISRANLTPDLDFGAGKKSLKQ